MRVVAPREVEFAAADGTALRGYCLEPTSEIAECHDGFVVFVPGGLPAWLPDEDARERRTGLLVLAEVFASAGLTGFVFSGRGFPPSGGRRLRQQDSTSDLIGALRFVGDGHGRDRRIGLVGYSVGGAAAVKVASEDDRVHAVCTYGTLASYRKAQEDGRLREVTEAYWKKSGEDVSLEVFRERYGSVDPIEFARSVRGHVLIAGGSLDAKYSNLHELLALAGGFESAASVELMYLMGWGHVIRSDVRGFEQGARSLAGWMRDALSRRD